VKLKRKQDWPEILAARVEAYRHEPFRWGVHDCALFCADVIQAMTGIDFAEQFRGRYENREEAEKFYPNGLREFVGRFLYPEISPKFAQRGDVVFFDSPGFGNALGICIGHMVASSRERGMEFIPMHQWIAAWRIG